jgi:hypothetical protein
MSESLKIRKEVVVKDDGRKVIFYTFEREILAQVATLRKDSDTDTSSDKSIPKETKS